jgi:hypothetical protein
VLAKNRIAFDMGYGPNIRVFDQFSGNLRAVGETLSLLKPGAPDLLVDRVRYEAAALLPVAAPGASLLVWRPTKLSCKSAPVLRPVPACAWWPCVFSQLTRVRVGDDGKVPVNPLRCAIDAPPRSTVVPCLRPDGDIYFLSSPSDYETQSVVLLHHPNL